GCAARLHWTALFLRRCLRAGLRPRPQGVGRASEEERRADLRGEGLAVALCADVEGAGRLEGVPGKSVQGKAGRIRFLEQTATDGVPDQCLQRLHRGEDSDAL